MVDIHQALGLHDEYPWSQQYYVYATKYYELDAVAREYEALKSIVLDEMKNNLIRSGMAVSRAESEARGSTEYRNYVQMGVEARTKANLARAKMQASQMKFEEWRSINARNREEIKLNRSGF